MPRFSSAGDIINRAAVEAGLFPEGDPVASSDESYVQLRYLLDGAGQELVELHPWQGLIKPYQVITQHDDTGIYPLPDDFGYMIDQTGWERSNTRPMGGPLTPQDWTYLKGRDLVSQSINASFRLADNELQIYPNDPVMPGLDINFEYINRNWVVESSGVIYRDTIGNSTDTILFDANMVVKFLKAKFLEAKGFDSTMARNEFAMLFEARTGKDAGAPVLNASFSSRGEPYLNGFYSVPNTGYGM